MDAGSFFWSFCWGMLPPAAQTPHSPVPAALSRPRGNPSPGFLGDMAQVRWARSDPRRAARGRGVTLRGRAIAARRLPAAAPSHLGTFMYFLFACFSRKSLAERQGQPGLSSSVFRFFGPFSQGPPQAAAPRHSPPSKSTAPALPSPSRRHQLDTTSSQARGSPRSSGQARNLSSDGVGLASQIPTDRPALMGMKLRRGGPGPTAPGPGPGGDSGGSRGRRAGRVGMPGWLDTVITNHHDNPLLPAVSYCGVGCKGQKHQLSRVSVFCFLPELHSGRGEERDQERLLNLCSETLLHPLGNTA